MTIIQMLKNDPDFRRGVRRGVGLMLASFVISQSLGCALYPLLGAWAAILVSAAITTGFSVVFVARRL